MFARLTVILIKCLKLFVLCTKKLGRLIIMARNLQVYTGFIDSIFLHKPFHASSYGASSHTTTNTPPTPTINPVTATTPITCHTDLDLTAPDAPLCPDTAPVPPPRALLVAVGVNVVCCAATPVRLGRLVPPRGSSTTVEALELRLAWARPIW